MYVFYSALLAIALVGGAPWFLYQALRRRKYLGSLRQRLGRLPVPFNLDGEPSIWIHAVSVGEVLAARPIAEELKTRFPGFRLLVSTTTAAGQQLAKRQLPEADAVFYFPIDLPWVVRRVLDRARPRLLVLMEGEIWPNILRECRRRGVKTAIVQRPRLEPIVCPIPAAAAAAAPRARRRGRLLHAERRVCPPRDRHGRGPVARHRHRQPQVRRRAPACRVRHGRPRDRVLRYFRVPHDRLVVVAGSTMRGEELPVLRAFRRVKARSPHALLIIAPRHPERFDEVMHIARGEGFATARRTDLAVDADPRADVVVLDTIGELAHALPDRDRGLRRRQPRADRRPQHPRAGGVRAAHRVRAVACPTSPRSPTCSWRARRRCRCASEAALEETLTSLAGDSVRRAALGAAARALVEANRGATRAHAGRHRAPAAASGGGAALPARPLTSLVLTIASRPRTPSARGSVGGRCRAHAPAATDDRSSASATSPSAAGQDAARGVHRATAPGGRRASGDPVARLCPHASRRRRHRRQRRRPAARGSGPSRRRAADAGARAAASAGPRLGRSRTWPADSPSSGWGPRSTCSTTASSTWRLRATSTCWSSIRTMSSGRGCCRRAGCASR